LGSAYDAGAHESAAVVPPDTTNPTVSVTAPTANAVITGATNSVTATASDNVAVAGVQFYLDYAADPATNKLGAEDTASPYSTNLNTSTLSNGSHTITAISRDAAGNLSTPSTITITVNNPTPPPDTTPPSIPTNLAKTSSTTTSMSLSWNASTDTGTNASGLAGYKLYRSVSGGAYAFLTNVGLSLSYTDNNQGTGLTPATAYAYKLSSIDNANNESSQSSALATTTNTASVTPPPTPPVIPPTVTKKGDCNGDNKVNGADLSILLTRYNSSYANADFTGDGKVTGADLSILLSNYGK
jgi:hypothetical protein